MRTELEQKLVDIILSDKYADTKVTLVIKQLEASGYMKHPLGRDPLHSQYDDRLLTAAEWQKRYQPRGVTS